MSYYYKKYVNLTYFCYLLFEKFDKVYIWDSKSLQDRTVPLPQAIKQRLKAQVDYVEGIHVKDIADGYGTVYMPYALERKYPNAKFETKWQFAPHLRFSDRGIGI